MEASACRASELWRVEQGGECRRRVVDGTAWTACWLSVGVAAPLQAIHRTSQSTGSHAAIAFVDCAQTPTQCLSQMFIPMRSSGCVWWGRRLPPRCIRLRFHFLHHRHISGVRAFLLTMQHYHWMAHQEYRLGKNAKALCVHLCSSAWSCFT